MPFSFQNENGSWEKFSVDALFSQRVKTKISGEKRKTYWAWGSKIITPLFPHASVTVNAITEIYRPFKPSWIKGRLFCFCFFSWGHKTLCFEERSGWADVYMKGHKPDQKTDKKGFKRRDARAGLLNPETTSACSWKIATIWILTRANRLKGTFFNKKKSYLHIEEFVHICDTGYVFPICSLAFAFANSNRQFSVAGVFVTSQRFSSPPESSLEQILKCCGLQTKKERK